MARGIHMRRNKLNLLYNNKNLNRNDNSLTMKKFQYEYTFPLHWWLGTLIHSLVEAALKAEAVSAT